MESDVIGDDDGLVVLSVKEGCDEDLVGAVDGA